MKEEIRKAIKRLSGFDRKHADEAAGAAEALGALGARALCAALGSPEALNVPAGRRMVSAQLGTQDASAVAPALLRALAHKDWRPNQVACDAIGLMKEAMTPALIDNLETEREPNGRLNTILILRRMGVSAAAPSLAKLAREDPDAEIRAAAVEALGHLGVSQAAAAVVVALDDTSPAVRLKSVKAAGWLRMCDATEGILAFARLADTEGRAAAVYALDRIGEVRATPFVVDCLKDADPCVRWSATVALRRLWQEDCETALEKALDDTEETVAAAALETLCIVAPTRARELLVAAMEDPRPALQRTAEFYSGTAGTG